MLLNVPAALGANLPSSPGEGIAAATGTAVDPHSLPGVWVRWDSGYYLSIAANGYSPHGQELIFFPAYPFFIRSLAFGLPSLMAWSGFLVSNLAFILAALLLWHQVRTDFNESIAWGTMITLSVFPTSLFFSAVYTESLFLLFSVLVYWFSARKRYVLAGLFVSAASLTRVNGFLLVVIPLVEILLNRPSRFWARVVVTGFVSGIGLGFYGLYLWVTQGSPVAFALVSTHWWRIAWPWQTVFDSLAVVVAGRGGFQDNWFMRVASAEDLLATLLFIVCTILAFFFVRRSLFAYSVAAMLLFLVSHGPHTFGLWSMSRYVLGLFSGFIVLGILLDRIQRLKWGVWVMGAILLFFLTGWFASGRWVA
jgi:Gpi18-like mannosyltransferase